MNDRSGSPRRIVVGISGASGAIYGVRLLQMLRRAGVESHLVMSRSAQVTLSHETSLRMADLQALADISYANADIGAAISSGSFRVDGMIVAPCSIKTLSEIATGCTGSLISRAADVMLKERRRLVLMVRETPLHARHIRSMAGRHRRRRDRLSAGTRVLRQARDVRGDGRPYAWPRAGSLRHRCAGRAALGRPLGHVEANAASKALSENRTRPGTARARRWWRPSRRRSGWRGPPRSAMRRTSSGRPSRRDEP
jgi:4-hydroxy-3-polyprenylbenzoate decarboxylase